MTGGLLAAHWCHPGHIQVIPTVAPRREVGLEVGTQIPVPMATLGRSGLSSNHRRTLPHRLAGGVGLGPDRPPLPTKVTGEGVGQYPGEAPAQTSPPPLRPLAESWS